MGVAGAFSAFVFWVVLWVQSNEPSPCPKRRNPTSLAADGAIACFSSIFPSADADRAQQMRHRALLPFATQEVESDAQSRNPNNFWRRHTMFIVSSLVRTISSEERPCSRLSVLWRCH